MLKLTYFWHNHSLDSSKGFFISFCGCLIVACVFGSGNSYPSFTKKIEDDPDFASNKPSETMVALGSSLIYGISPVSSIVCGVIIRYIGTRYTCMICACFLFLSFFISSFLDDYRAVIVVLGLLMSVAYGIVLNAPAVTASTWFSLKKPMGMGIVYAGAGLGMVTIPIMVGQLIDTYGWRSTLRRVSALSIISLFAAFFMVQRSDDKVDENNKSNASEKYDEENKNNSNEDIKADSEVVNVTSTDGAHKDVDFNKENKNNVVQSNDDINTEVSAENNKTVNEPKDLPLTRDVTNVSDISHEPDFLRRSIIALINSHRCINTNKATAKEFLFNIILTKAFISLFFAYVLFSFGFFGELYIIVPYPAFWIGKKDTIYESSPKISLQSADFGSLAYGLGRLTGGPICGFIATRLTDRYSYVLITFTKAILMASIIAARPLYSFIIIYYLMGFCVGGFYATFFSLVTRRFYGPNLGITMGIIVVAALPGGFCSPLITASMLDKYENFTYALIFFALCYLTSSVLILVTMEDRLGNPIVLGEGVRQLQAHKEKLANLSKLSLSHVPLIPTDNSRSFILFKKKLFKE